MSAPNSLRWRRYAALAALVAAASVVGVRAEIEVEGVASVHDGDTLVVDGRTLRLEGVHAPRIGQICAAGGFEHPCGREAAEALRQLVDGHAVRCRVLDSPAIAPRPSVCRRGETVLNRWLVAHGWALAASGQSDLREHEARARAAGLGFWRDAFEPNDAWKRAAGLELEPPAAGCSACELRHRRLSKRLKAKQLSSGGGGD